MVGGTHNTPPASVQVNATVIFVFEQRVIVFYIKKVPNVEALGDYIKSFKSKKGLQHPTLLGLSAPYCPQY